MEADRLGRIVIPLTSEVSSWWTLRMGTKPAWAGVLVSTRKEEGAVRTIGPIKCIASVIINYKPKGFLLFVAN